MNERGYSVSGVDYTGTFQEFDQWFNAEDACLSYIGKLRWPQGFRCPACGILQGAIHPAHLAYYLDEFTFRFNRRRSKARGMLFYRLLEAAVDCDPVPRQKIIGGRPLHIVYG